MIGHSLGGAAVLAAAGDIPELTAVATIAAPSEPAHVRLRHSRVHAEDCTDCETESGQISEIEREIRVEGQLTEAERQRLLEIANKCPVHRTLTGEIKVRSRLAGKC